VDSFVSELTQDGQILTVEREVDPRFELAAVTQAVQGRGNEALLFKNVRGTRFPVVSNLYGSPERIARVLGARPRGFCQAWAQALTGGPHHPRDHSGQADASLHRGQLSDLPLIWYSEHDGGPYFTGGVFHAKDPDRRIPNLSFHRSMYISDRELRVRLAPGHDLTAYHQRAEESGAPLEAAILIGTSPEVFLAAASRLPREGNELELAERLGGPIELRHCQEIDLEVPADTHIVIEGRFLPSVRRPEGPFGEFMGYYVPVEDNAVFEVLNVTWKEGALFHSINCGSGEEVLPLGLISAATSYQYLSSKFTGVADVAFHPLINLTAIKLDQQYAGQAAEIARCALEEPIRSRICAVIDPDIDIYDLHDVIWALLTRGEGAKDVVSMPGRPSFFRDPQSSWGRFAVDACVPWGRRAEFKRKRIPGMNDIRISEYVREYAS